MKKREAIATISSLALAVGVCHAQGYKPKCDDRTKLCRTDIKEWHQDDPGAIRVRLTYDAPAGVTFRFPATGVELEAGGKDHHVQIFFDAKNPAHFDCEWYAEKIWFGDNGLAKGYCEIAFSGTAQ
jgi:hypothetical protein